MKKFLLFLFSLLVGFGLFIWIGKTVGWQEIKRAFLVFTGWHGFAILGLTLLMALVGTWKWREILKGIGTKISFGELFKPYLAGFSIMYLLPMMVLSGEILRGYVLKEKNQIPYSKGIASIVIERIFEWTVNLTIIFLGILFFLLTIGLPPAKLGVIFGGVFFIFVAGITFFYLKCFKRESLVRFFLRSGNNQPLEIEKEIFNFFKSKKKAMWRSFGLTLLRAGIMWFRVWVLIFFLGKEISVLPALSILGFSYLAAIIPIPTALGSHEAIQTFAFGSLGLGLSTATVFTMIIRGAELILALAGVIILFRLGLFLLKNTLFKKLNPVRNSTISNEVNKPN